MKRNTDENQEKVILLNNSLLPEKTFAVFESTNIHDSLVHLSQKLLNDQKLHWRQLADGYKALELVRSRTIVCHGYSVSVQFNPKRISSTGADLDPKSIQRRPCFLCLENLPEAQKGILVQENFLLLCNPMPIFPQHFTLSSIHHVPQELESSLVVLLDIAKNLSPDYTVFYNGPKSGASAPDHMHFQVGPRRALPIEVDAVDMHRRKRLYYQNHIAGSLLTEYGRTALIIESTDKERLLGFLGNFLNGWKKILNSSEEPKMNLLVSYQEDVWRLIILPRRKHRPEVYFKEGEDRVLISPAAVDLGGLLVTPLEKDFLRSDAKLIEDIYEEVSDSPEVIEHILGNIQ
jgi:hypothetical protein